MTSKTPSVTDARAAAKAASEDEKVKKNTETNEKRTLLYGKVIVKLEELMKDDDVEDIPVLESVLELLNDEKAGVKSAKKTRTSIVARFLK